MTESNFDFDLSNALRALIVGDDPNGIPPGQSYGDAQFQAAMLAAINTFKLQAGILYPSEATFMTGLFDVFNLNKNIPFVIDPTYNQAYPDMLAKNPITFAESLGIGIPANVAKFSYFVMTYSCMGATTLNYNAIQGNTTTIIVFIYTTT